MTRKKTLSKVKKASPSTPAEHPGLLLQQFIMQQGIYQMEAAKYIAMTPSNLNDIVRGIRSITPDIALRLGKAFNTDPLYWLTLQLNYDLARTKLNHRTIKKMGKVIVFKRSAKH
jgi:addiction module HigA family antidote